MISVAMALVLSANQIDKEPASHPMLSGTYSNEEHVYFEKDAGRESPPWTSLKVVKSDQGWQLWEVDAHGRQLGEPQSVGFQAGKERDIVTVGSCSRYFDRVETTWTYSSLQNRKACRQKFQITEIGEDGLKLRFSNGVETELKRVRNVICWAAIPKSKKKNDGSTDWLFERNLSLHDQGGRVTIGGGDSGAEEVTLRMRAVHWPPPSTNRPSMVLYIHKDDPNRAASYSWADIDASRVGINLRWMQASCTIEGAERASEVTNSNFRG